MKINYPLPPGNSKVDHKKLANCFQKTTASYKYYWFKAILSSALGRNRLLINGEERLVSYAELVFKMISMTWFSVNFFHLNLGKLDMIQEVIGETQKRLGLTPNTKSEVVFDSLVWLRDNGTKEDREWLEKKVIARLTRYVSTCFLQPWIGTAEGADACRLSADPGISAPYRLVARPGGKKIGMIEVNPAWHDYFREHYSILDDFVNFELCRYLQSKNPNTPGIINKLEEPQKRASLNSQKAYWKKFMDAGHQVRTPYGGPVSVDSFALDHFLPWSFVTHDQIWNLIPCDAGINSSKSNKIPDIDTFITPVARLQREILIFYSHQPKMPKTADDFLNLGHTAAELATFDEDSFVELYQKTMQPLSQIALNMGFQKWEYKGGAQ